MASETVTIGDTEVEIRETADGFEAVEVEEEELYVRAQSAGTYGFEIPLAEADEFMIARRHDEEHRNNPFAAFWNTDADVSEMGSHGSRDEDVFDEDVPSRFDGNAVVGRPEIVER